MHHIVIGKKLIKHQSWWPFSCFRGIT